MPDAYRHPDAASREVNTYGRGSPAWRAQTERIGAAIQTARKNRGMSLADVAQIAGVGVRYIQNCLKGTDRLGLKPLRAVADALDLDLDELLKPGTGDPAGAVEAPPFPRRAGATRPSPPFSASQAPAAERGPDAPEVRAGEPPRTSGTKPLAERQKEQLAAIQAARSALAKGQRQRRARPWQGRDPYRNAVPGARKLPPERER
jgi:transcriptional regulator with XRE-family HTH domain